MDDNFGEWAESMDVVSRRWVESMGVVIMKWVLECVGVVSGCGYEIIIPIPLVLAVLYYIHYNLIK